MGEAVKIVINVAGAMCYILGIFANLNNIVGVVCGLIGAYYMYEIALKKRIERKILEEDLHIKRAERIATERKLKIHESPS